MKSIQALYKRVKACPLSERPSAQSVYESAITELLENSPADYLVQLEYIICSRFGLNSFKTFQEKYTIPLCGYLIIEEVAEDLAEKAAERSTVDPTPYRELASQAKGILDKHQRLLAMFEYYSEGYKGNYISDYYESLVPELINGDPNRIITRFGAVALPDTIMDISESARIETVDFAGKHMVFDDPTAKQWLAEIQHDEIFGVRDKVYYPESPEEIVRGLKERSAQLYRESVLMGEDLEMEHTDTEIRALEDYISFKEHLVTALRTDDAIDETQKLLVEAYEHLDGMVEEFDIGESEVKESADDYTEFTSYKKTGQIPGYLGKKHDLGYGEDDDSVPSKDSSDDDADLADYKRPEKSDAAPSDDSSSDSAPSSEPSQDSQPIQTSMGQPKDSSGVVNHYYYNYTNSFNKHKSNVNSHNPVNSQVGSHTESVIMEDTTPYQNYWTAEREAVRRIAEPMFKELSQFIEGQVQLEIRKNPKYTVLNTDPIIDEICRIGTEQIWVHNESVVIFQGSQNYEHVTKVDHNHDLVADLFRTVAVKLNGAFPQYFRSFLEIADNKGWLDFSDYIPGIEVLIKRPPDKIPITLAGRNLIFSSEPGYAYEVELIKDIAKCPAAMLTFWLNQDKICFDQIGIKDAIIKYVRNTEYEFPDLNKLSETDMIDRYMLPLAICFKPTGHVGLVFKTPLDPEHGFGINITPELRVSSGQDDHGFGNVRKAMEAWELDPFGDNVYQEGFLTTLGALTLVTIVVYGIAITAAGISYSRDMKALKASILEAFGKDYSPDVICNRMAKPIIVSELRRRKNDILKYFYKPDKTKSRFISDSKISVNLWYVTKHSKRADSFKPENLHCFSYSLIHGIIRKADISKMSVELTDKESVSFGIVPDEFIEDLNSAYYDYHLASEAFDYYDDELQMFHAAGLMKMEQPDSNYYDDSNDYLQAFQEYVDEFKKVLETYSLVYISGTIPLLTLAGMIRSSADDIIATESVFSEGLFSSGPKLPRWEWELAPEFREFCKELRQEYQNTVVEILKDPKYHLWTKNKGFIRALIDSTKERTSQERVIIRGLMVKLEHFVAYGGGDLGYDEPDVTDDELDIFLGLYNEFDKDIITRLSAIADTKYSGTTVALNEENVISSFDILFDSITSKRIVEAGRSIAFSEKKSDVPPEEGEEPEDPEKPQSDHPIADALSDLDRKLTRKTAAVKKKANEAINVGKAAVKPIKRGRGWINNIISRFKDANVNNIKEKMAEPKERMNVFKAVKMALIGGSLLKAGILLNPIFLFLAATKKLHNKANYQRIRNEMMMELKTEIQIIDEKIKDADRNGDNAAKYKLMRLKKEITQKMLRVGSEKSFRKNI